MPGRLEESSDGRRARAGDRDVPHFNRVDAATRLKADDTMTAEHRALPMLLRICADIDRLFVIEVGPFGTELAHDARAAWLATGNKIRPSDAEQYVDLLAGSIENHGRREAFVADARKCIRL